MSTITTNDLGDGKRSYTARLRYPNGQVRNKTMRNKRALEEWVTVERAKMTQGGWVDPRAGKVTLRSYATEWVEHRTGLRPRTRELYEGLLRLHVLPGLGDLPLSRITPPVIREWHSGLLRVDTPRPVTVAKAYRLLRSILNTAVTDDVIMKNPCHIRGAGGEPSPERPVATVDQVWALADAIDPRFRALVLTAAFTGLRYGELAGLARRHVNLLHKSITVERQLVQHTGGHTEFGPPKTAAGLRTLAIPDELVSELDHHLSMYAAPGRDGLVFVGAKGAHLIRGNWLVKWKKATAEVADLPEGFRFHDLRHTSNTLAAASGASTKELMRRLGQASPRAALLYQHATDSRDVDIAKAVGEALRRREGRSIGG